MASYMRLENFGRSVCKFKHAIDVEIENLWPTCIRNDLPNSKISPLSQVRRYFEKECVLRHSRMTVVVENSHEKGYMSEKIYQAFSMGTVPIYYGARNASDLLPHPDAAILIEDFPTIKVRFCLSASTDQLAACLNFQHS